MPYLVFCICWNSLVSWSYVHIPSCFFHFFIGWFLSICIVCKVWFHLWWVDFLFFICYLWTWYVIYLVFCLFLFCFHWPILLFYRLGVIGVVGYRILLGCRRRMLWYLFRCIPRSYLLDWVSVGLSMLYFVHWFFRVGHWCIWGIGMVIGFLLVELLFWSLRLFWSIGFYICVNTSWLPSTTFRCSVGRLGFFLSVFCGLLSRRLVWSRWRGVLLVGIVFCLLLVSLCRLVFLWCVIDIRLLLWILVV